jgi:hypothetical protein
MRHQYTPAGPDLQGRDRFAEFCRALHGTLPGNELARHFARGGLCKVARREFSEAEIANMLAARLRAQRRELRKGVGLRAALAEFSAAAREAGIKVTHAGVEKVSKAQGANGIPADLSAFKHLPRGQLAKGTGRPPEPEMAMQSDNATWTDARCDDGAGLAHDVQAEERAAAGVRQQASPFGPRQAASMSSREALPTDTDAEPRPGEGFTQWLKRQRPRTLQPGAGALASDADHYDDYVLGPDAVGPNGSAVGTHTQRGAGDADQTTAAERGNRMDQRHRRAFGY